MTVLSGNKQYIFGEDMPFLNCHASTLARLSNGELMSAWFGGTCEGDPDVNIWISKRVQGQWTYPVKIAEEDGMPHWNPVLFVGNNHKLYLYYKVGHTIPGWYTRFICSDDDGQTWSQPQELVKGDIGGRGPVRNKPIILQEGTWLAPASLESDVWDAFADLSYNQGETWIKSETVPYDHRNSKDKGVIQPTLWESEKGNVHMLLRSSEGCIFRSNSQDGGKTWCQAYPIQLPNNNCGIDLVKTDNGVLVLVYNPVSGNWAARTPLAIGISYDNGVTWHEEALTLEDEPGEYSYPAIIIDSNDQINVTYTWNRKRIAFWELSLKTK